jgi:hypothetical protein
VNVPYIGFHADCDLQHFIPLDDFTKVDDTSDQYCVFQKDANMAIRSSVIYQQECYPAGPCKRFGNLLFQTIIYDTGMDPQVGVNIF